MRSGAAGRAGAIALALGAAASYSSAASATVTSVTITPVNIDLVAFGEGNFVPIFFDGVPEPAFGVTFATSIPPSLFVIEGADPTATLISVSGSGSPANIIATKLTGGATINAATFTNNSPDAGMKSPSHPSTFFVPLEVTLDGTDWYYGWAKFSDSVATLNFDSYGFSFTPNVAITTPIPEPSTWGLLAIGAAGVLAIRRRSRSLVEKSC
jgi:hypothetical protein